MPSKPPKLVLFDCDGTLVDSQHSIIEAMDITCKTYKLPPLSRESIRRVIGLPLENAIAHFYKDLPREAHYEMADTYRKHFKEMRLKAQVQEPLFDDIFELIETFHEKGWILGIATGKAMRGLIPTLQTHGLEKYFSTLQTPDTARGKPHPDMVFNAMSETGIAANDTIVIGDTTYDIEMAGHAHVKSVGVSWGYHDPHDLLDAGAHKVVDCCEELHQTVKSLLEVE